MFEMTKRLNTGFHLKVCRELQGAVCVCECFCEQPRSNNVCLLRKQEHVLISSYPVVSMTEARLY